MPKKYFVCIYRGRYEDYDYYEADKCLVKAEDEKTARRLGGEKLFLSEPFWEYLDIWEFDEDDFVE